MTLLKQFKLEQTLVTIKHMCYYILQIIQFTVIKAEHVPYDNVGETYQFPDEGDDLSNYTGGSAQVIIPNGLLQAIGKHT